MISVLFFAYLKDLIPGGKVKVDLPAETTVQELSHLLVERFPILQDKLQSAIKSVNREFASDEQVLHDGDEVAFFPPVSGGGNQPPVLLITPEPLSADDLVRKLSNSTTGAVCCFSGVVRENTVRENRITPELFYEAYESMAYEKMRQITEEIYQRWPAIEQVAIIQRTGLVRAGETSTLVACSSSHRDSGIFAATQFGIDRLKEIVPVWKKEISEHGEAWVSGDYHPRPGE